MGEVLYGIWMEEQRWKRCERQALKRQVTEVWAVYLRSRERYRWGRTGGDYSCGRASAPLSCLQPRYWANRQQPALSVKRRKRSAEWIALWQFGRFAWKGMARRRSKMGAAMLPRRLRRRNGGTIYYRGKRLSISRTSASAFASAHRRGSLQPR